MNRGRSPPPSWLHDCREPPGAAGPGTIVRGTRSGPGIGDLSETFAGAEGVAERPLPSRRPVWLRHPGSNDVQSDAGRPVALASRPRPLLGVRRAPILGWPAPSIHATAGPGVDPRASPDRSFGLTCPCDGPP